MENWDLLPEKEKYNYLSRLLKDIKSSDNYQGEKISGDPLLEKKRDDDVYKFRKIISDELIKDGILAKIINGEILKRIED